MTPTVFRSPVLRLALALTLVLALFSSTFQSVSAGAIPTFSIISVEKDVKVEIKTFNLPAGKTFTVRMGPYGTLGIGGTTVGTFDSGSGGSLTKTFNIPDGLKGSQRIAIRMDADSGGYYAYNWFWNNPSSSSGAPTPIPGYSGIPTFSIVSVEKDSKVTIKTNNFPPSMTFKVLMGKYGTKGIGGTQVATTDSGSGGTFTKTYDIPDGLKGDQKIAIRLEGTGGYYAFNWFWNNSTSGSSPAPTPVPGATPVPSSYSGYPYFYIQAVVKDSKVTIKGYNFPAGQTFTVRMGPYGSLGIGGTSVGTTDTGSGGNLSATYTIPDGLKGSQKIAIRMDSSSGYYAYNWFWNNNAP